MKKLFAVVVMTVAMAMPSHAQMSWGLQAGLNMSNVNTKMESSHLIGCLYNTVIYIYGFGRKYFKRKCRMPVLIYLRNLHKNDSPLYLSLSFSNCCLVSRVFFINAALSSIEASEGSIPMESSMGVSISGVSSCLIS